VVVLTKRFDKLPSACRSTSTRRYWAFASISAWCTHMLAAGLQALSSNELFK
jgi:hypothetical protein